MKNEEFAAAQNNNATTSPTRMKIRYLLTAVANSSLFILNLHDANSMAVDLGFAELYTILTA